VIFPQAFVMRLSAQLRQKRKNARKTAARSHQWSLVALEPRLMLAGDAGAEVAAAMDAVDDSAVVENSSTTAPVEIAFVDAGVQSHDQLAELIRDGVEVVLIDAASNPISQITEAIRRRSNIAALHIVSHGQSGSLQLGGQVIDTATLRNHFAALESWQAHLRHNADILIYGCNVGAGSQGEQLLRVLAESTGADVAASNNTTGAANLGGDWLLETTIGEIHSDLLASMADLQSLELMLPITVYAAGSTGSEQMQLQVGGTIVQTWNNVGGNADSGQFQAFTYSGAATATPDQVRVLFTNDLYEPAQNLDRNLRVDRIDVNGITVQSEDQRVFSTGTWLPADGIQPGFRQSEWLHGNGYFQYPSSTQSTSTISIFAAGNENSETMELWIGGSRVASWNNIGGDADSRQFVNYSFTANSKVTADQVQIRFTNDLYENDGAVDRNLRVDRIVIDGTTYQTEAPNVYSTGTYQNGGITPGYKQDETLHSNGYFQFGATLNPGVIALQTSNVSVNENAGTAVINVVRTGGSDGIVRVDYATQAGTATAGSDYTTGTGTLTFADGETTKAIVVPIINDSLVESTESFNVTIDNVTGGATLLVPRTATVTIIDDEVALPSYSNFTSVAGLDLNGDARLTNGALELTTATLNKAGSAFYTTPIKLSQNASFRSSFSFQITGGGGTNGADGLTFTIQNDPRGAGALGGGGGQLGYEGITKSVAIEFDTYRNGSLEVNGNHVSIISGGIYEDLRTGVPNFDLNDGRRYYAWVDYNGVSDNLSVYLSATATKPTLALIKTTVDLGSIVGNSGYVGFTAGTGGLSNSHRILNWSLDQQAPQLDPPTQGGGTVNAVTVVSGLTQPTAIDWLPNGTMLIAEKSGIVKAAVNGAVGSTPFIDISRIVNGTRDRGLLDIAVHPDFANNPYVYLLFTYDPPEVYNQAAGTLAGPDGNGNRAGRLIRVTANAATDYRTAVAGSEVVLLGANSTWANFNGFANSTFDFNEPPAGERADGTYIEDFINSDSESHTVGALAFGIDGALFVSIGDGASYNRVDVRADRVQDIDSLSGKVLRIDPLTGRGLADNPFYNGNPNANRSKVYQLGLRNPFRMSVDSVTGQLYVGDVGWTKWEEINSAGAGANFGWPYYEGGSGTNSINTGYQNTPEGAAFFAQNIAVTPALYALNHQADGINAIVMGDVYRGTLYGAEYEGDVFFNDLGQGIVRHGTIDAAGQITNVKTFATGASVVVSISQGPDGALYYVDLDDNRIGRWEIV
jgi:glucose/arabinose dehydrogenase